MDQTNYRAILGDYWFAEKAKCCLGRPKGYLCNRPHNFGFVVKLRDESVSIVGNDCGASKLDATSSLSRDRNLYLNLKARKKAEERLQELLSGKDAALAAVKGGYEALSSASDRMDELLATFGPKCANQLRTLSHGGTGGVQVSGIKIRTGVIEGKRYTERQVIPIPVGILRGTQILRSDLVLKAKGDLRAVVGAFSAAEGLTRESKTKEIESVASTIADLSRVTAGVEQLLEAERGFLACDWSPLPFLVRDESERIKLVRQVLKQAGTPGGSDKAKRWLAQFENQLMERHGVDKLEIAY